MPNTLNLIEQVRRRVPRETDYAVAKALEMQQSTLARVLAGKQGLGPKAVVRVSEILQRDLRDILVLVEEDKAVRPKDREFWERRSPRITAAIAVAVLALAAAVRIPSASMGLYNRTASSFPFYTLCEVIRLVKSLIYLIISPGRWFTIRARQPQSRLALIATAGPGTF